jgi:tetratricopeptide (TPR) repeat protein
VIEHMHRTVAFNKLASARGTSDTRQVSLLGRILGRGDRAMVVQPGLIVLRRREHAEVMRRPTQPNFSDELPAQCDKCDASLEEVFITTGGALGDPELWRDHPVAVDGWACAECGVFSYPRRVTPAQITELATEGVDHGRAGRFAEAELCFARMVWNWPGYVAGHLNYAEAIRDRLHRAPPSDDATRRRVTRRMIEHYEEAVEAFTRDGGPGAAAGSISRACITLAELAIQDRALDRARRFLDLCLALAGIPEVNRISARELADYVATRRDLFDEAARVLSPRIRLADRPPRPPATPEERKAIVEAIERLEQHIERAPDRWQAAWLHAKALALVGKNGEALDAWRRAFQRFGSQRELARDFGIELLEAERHAEARDVNRAITERLPDDATLWCNLAVTELLCGDLDAADRALDRSMTLDPGDKIAHLLRGRLAAYRSGQPLPRTLRELERRA